MSSTTALGALASRAGYLSSFGRKFGSGTGAVRGQQDEIGPGGGGIDGDLSKREAEIPHDVQTKLMTDCEKVSIMAIIFMASGGLWRGIRCCAIVNATCGCQRFTFWHRPTPRSNLGLCDQSSQLPDQYSRYRVSLGCFCSYRSSRLVKVGGMTCLGEESSLDCQNRGDGGIASHHAEQEDTVLVGPEAWFTWRTD